MKFKVEYEDGEFERETRKVYRAIARASKRTITEAGRLALERGRADIAAAGLGSSSAYGSEFVTGLKVNVYPKGNKESVNAAAYVTHKLGFIGVFEEGATIKGSPLLWVPLPGVPKMIGGKRTTAALYGRTVAKLFRIQGRRYPILARKEGKQLIPVFVGLDSVTIRKRLHIGEIVERIRNELPELFEKNIEAVT